MNAPIRLRLAAAFAGTLAVVLVVIGILVFVRFRQDADRAIDAELRVRANLFFEARSRDPQLREDLLGLSDEHFGQALDSSGRVTAASRQVTRAPLTGTESLGFRNATVLTRVEPREVRLFVARRGATTLILASARDDRNDALGHLTNLLWVGGGATLVIASALAWVLAGAALRPVERLRRNAVDYSAHDFDQRIALPRANDELRRLAATLNALLDRVQTSFERQRSFVDRASHELRTPLANLSLELELALRREHSVDELREALQGAANEAQRLDRLAANLLILARTTDGMIPIAPEPTDIGALVDATVRSFSARADAAGLELVADQSPVPPISVDPVRIRQALTNLLDNAIRVSPRGSAVTVRVRTSGATVSIAVADDGPGFSPELALSAFDVFARGRGADRSPDGAGLGLAIVSAVAAAHGGTATIESVPRGAMVVMTLPA